jgi:hypothetical protein
VARVADYVIIRDDWVFGKDAAPITFNIPSNAHTGSRSVLSFMFKVDTSGPMTMKVSINGTEVWVWKADGSLERPMHRIQEVVEANILKPGENVFRWKTSGEDERVTKISDVVLALQVET